MAVIVYQMASAAQNLDVEPDAVAYWSQPDPVPEHRRPGEPRLGRHAEPDDPVRGGRVRPKAQGAALLRAAENDERAVREDVGHLGGILAFTDEELAQSRIRRDHDLTSDGREPAIRHEFAGADSCAVHDHRSRPLILGFGQIAQGRAELQAPALGQQRREQVVQVSRHVHDRRGVSPARSEPARELRWLASGGQASAAGERGWLGFGLAGGRDETGHLRNPCRRVGRERAEPSQRVGSPRADTLVGADEVRTPERSGRRRCCPVRRVSRINIDREARLEQGDRGTQAADTSPDYQDIGALAGHIRHGTGFAAWMTAARPDHREARTPSCRLAPEGQAATRRHKLSVRSREAEGMGIAIGIVLIAATIASFVMINARVGRMAKQYSDPSSIDPQTGQRVPGDQGPGHGGHHGGANHGGGNHGFSGGHGGGHHG
jgi:hypothetical protein